MMMNQQQGLDIQQILAMKQQNEAGKNMLILNIAANIYAQKIELDGDAQKLCLQASACLQAAHILVQTFELNVKQQQEQQNA